MKLIIDDANIENIKEIYSYYPVDGVTSNPTILSKSKQSPKDCLLEIRDFIGDDKQLHVQVISKDWKNMLEEAHKIVENLGENTYIKIPSCKEGFKAMRELSKENIKITATAIYSPMQAFLAAKSGANYVAPYVNRIDNLGYDGVDISLKIHQILKNNDLDCQVLAASFKNSSQVLKLLENGIGAATCSPDVIEKLVDDKNVEAAIDVFIKDFQKISGNNMTMKDIF